MTTAATSSAARQGVPETNTIQVSESAVRIAGAVLVVVFVAVFWDWFAHQYRLAYMEPSDWGHTAIIPFVSCYFVWLQRDKIRKVGFKSSFTGLIPLLLGLSVYMIAAVGPAPVQHHNLRGFGVCVSAFGILVLLFGWPAMRYLTFPWAYWTVFGQTISERVLSRVTERMQDWSAMGADVLLNLITIDTDRVGNVLTIHLSNGTSCPLNVAEACSGMRMLVAFMALGVAVAFMGLSSWWQRTLLVVIGVPISLFVNVLRVASLGVLALWDANFTAGQFHAVVGLVWLVPALLLFLGAMWVIRNLTTDAPTAKAKPKSSVVAAARTDSGGGEANRGL